jgi:hypothetical protein
MPALSSDGDHDTDLIGVPAPGRGFPPATRRSIAWTAAAGVLLGFLLGWACAGRRAAPLPKAPPPPPKAAAPKAPTAYEEFRRLVGLADTCYDEGVKRLALTDPADNPSGWMAENDVALEQFERAVDYYNQALELNEDRHVMARVQDANFKRVLARKRKLEASGPAK